jgi:hypothetical protein
MTRTRFAAAAIGVLLVIALGVSYWRDASNFSQWAAAAAAVALALLTSFLLLANYDLVVATQKLVKASSDQTAVLLASVEPELRVAWKQPLGPGPWETEVTYVSGTLPARTVRVYGRRANNLYQGATDTVTNNDHSRAVSMEQVDNPNWPFVLQPAGVVANQDWVGVTWEGHDGKQHKVRWKVDPGNKYVAIAS